MANKGIANDFATKKEVYDEKIDKQEDRDRSDKKNK